MNKNEICDGCYEPKPNVGNWEDGRRLCGGCKIKICLARPRFRESIERDLRAALSFELGAGNE